jgi:hypothetical protein
MLTIMERSGAEMTAESTPIACTLSDAELIDRGAWIADKVMSHCLEVRAAPHGYALRFADSDEVSDTLLQLIRQERECCRFFRFTLDYEPDLGPIWLTIQGPEGSEAIIAEMIGAGNGKAR